MNDYARVSEALSFIPADHRELWVRMGMAVKSALGDAGFDAWDAWSKTDARYNARDARSVWRSIKASGGIGPGTLYAEARRHGWDGTEPTIDPLAEARRRAQRAAEDKAAAERQMRQWQAAAAKAESLIKECRIGFHPYLDRKGFRHEQGLILGDDLLIPMRDHAAGTVNSIQRITAAGDKKFLSGGKARGSVFMLGNGSESWLCEGFATGLSTREALKALYRPGRIIVCFSAANLAHVATRIRGARFVIADNDSSGTGLRYAEETGLPFWMPPDVDSDANDFHRTHGVRALADHLNELRRQ